MLISTGLLWQKMAADLSETEAPATAYVVMYCDKRAEGPNSVHRTLAGAEQALREYLEEAWANAIDSGSDLPEVMPSDVDEACDLLGSEGRVHLWLEEVELRD
jgi:hypothetical protein